MPKYKVKVRMAQHYAKDIEVEADNLDGAIEEANDLVDSGSVSFYENDTVDYDHEICPDDVKVLVNMKYYDIYDICSSCYSHQAIVGIYPKSLCASCASGPVIIPPGDPVDPNEITIDLNLHNVDPRDLLMPTETPPSDPNWHMIPDFDYYWKQLGQCPMCKDGTVPLSQPGGGFSCPKCKWSLG